MNVWCSGLQETKEITNFAWGTVCDNSSRSTGAVTWSNCASKIETKLKVKMENCLCHEGPWCFRRVSLCEKEATYGRNLWKNMAKWYSFQKKLGSILADGVNRELVAARYDSIFNMTFQNGPLKRKSPKMMQALRVANSWASSKLISAKLLAIVPTIDVFVLEFLQEMLWAPATLDENGLVPSHTPPRSEHMDDVHGPDKGSQGSEGSQDVFMSSEKIGLFQGNLLGNLKHWTPPELPATQHQNITLPGGKVLCRRRRICSDTLYIERA